MPFANSSFCQNKLRRVICVVALGNCLLLPNLTQANEQKNLPASSAKTEVKESSPITSVEKSFPALDVLPPGTILKQVQFPRYKNFKLTGVLSANQMKVESADRVSGEQVIVQLINQDTSPTRVSLNEAEYNFKKGFLTAKNGISITDPRFDAQGKTLSLDVNSHQGFLSGPVQTRIIPQKKSPRLQVKP